LQRFKQYRNGETAGGSKKHKKQSGGPKVGEEDQERADDLQKKLQDDQTWRELVLSLPTEAKQELLSQTAVARAKADEARAKAEQAAAQASEDEAVRKREEQGEQHQEKMEASRRETLRLRWSTERIRGLVSLMLVTGFLVTTLLVIGFNAYGVAAPELLQTVASLYSGITGAVLGYYFGRQQSDG
jgi:cation transport ATPase